MVTVQYALEHSSDVGAAKMALKTGPGHVLQVHQGASGSATAPASSCPARRAGCCAIRSKWGSTSILSLAIGQEVGVTPVQLVTMVSTIANGGVYMPPHVLLQSTDELKGDARLQPAAFRPENQLPATLPDGAHRVIKELTAAKMRIDDAGHRDGRHGQGGAVERLQLRRQDGNGAEDRSGDAHLFAHQAGGELRGICAGQLAGDLGRGGDRYADGGQRIRRGRCRRRCFRQVAQQVLEYLGVPHDQPLKTPKELLAAATARHAGRWSERECRRPERDVRRDQ